ncbi:Peroxisomal membrane protein PAS20 [Cyphellophora attinorum]|uniref:Peroxin-13 n=1 Tax=Cyphellophora attinorum TaxID=1664694 RepID=A0A0N1I0T2_9EURO|nr:Peroxisomal membrane protein PAS20 [Phialophora attinorum]KPI45232.1 Peroxisomal membrane protein PAS20 [Phialophora attinorum]
MTTASPPKPWERAGAATPTATAFPEPSAVNATSLPTMTDTATSSIGAPSLPDRPNALNSVVNSTASNYANPNTTGAYGSAYSSPYSSPYNRFGSYGSSIYGAGYGGYGMGGMMGGGMMGGYGGMPGMPGGPGDQSLTQTWNQSTAATFQVMESIVRAFGGFAQMLESAYMTTHSSFFAMVSMAEQLGNLRHTLGSVLGIYAFYVGCGHSSPKSLVDLRRLMLRR